MEINIIKAIQSISNAFFDTFFLLCTRLGEEIFFFVLFSIFYWCYSKKSALKLSVFYMISAGVNFVLKALISRPRPYVADSSIINNKPAYGTSFPSGHSQSYALLATTTSLENHKYHHGSKSFRITIDIVLILGGCLVALSRMYLGQHYLTDTIAGLLIGFAVAYLCEMVFLSIEKKMSKKTIVIMLVCGAIFGLLAILVLALMKVDSVSVYKYLLIAICLIVGYFLEDRYIHYQPSTHAKKSLIRAVVGVFVLLVVYILIKCLIPNDWSTYLVCVLGSFMSTILLPWVFKMLDKEGKNHDHV